MSETMSVLVSNGMLIQEERSDSGGEDVNEEHSIKDINSFNVETNRVNMNSSAKYSTKSPWMI